MLSDYMEEAKEQQHFFMMQALAVGERGRLSSAPNPWVGCLLVKQGKIIAEGHTSVVGGPHAEVTALEMAQGNAKGATAYVTLEPCAHYGRTPPCTEALIKAGIAHVVIPFVDPDPLVAGRGIDTLQKAGIRVTVGVGIKEAQASLRPYLFHRKYRRPYTILKLASSLDGRIAAADGSSKWITGKAARQDVHYLRASSCGVAVGSGTAKIDQPSLTVRDLNLFHTPPKKILFDRSAKLPLAGYDLIFTSNPLHGYCEGEVFVVDKHRFFAQALDILGEKNFVQLLVEGGAQIHSGMRELAQQLTFYVGNCLLGSSGLGFTDSICSSIEGAARYELAAVHRLDNDIRLDYLKMGEKTEGLIPKS